MSSQKLADAARSRARAQRLRQLAVTLSSERDSAVALQEAQFFELQADRLETETIKQAVIRI